MDIHKPKPWHGWREFLKEYLIIVVGVLTALAFEQGVEWLHWRHVVEQERESLRLSAQQNEYAMVSRLQVEPCVTRRLAELDELFRRHSHGEPLGKIGPVGRPAYVSSRRTLSGIGRGEAPSALAATTRARSFSILYFTVRWLALTS